MVSLLAYGRRNKNSSIFNYAFGFSNNLITVVVSLHLLVMMANNNFVLLVNADEGVVGGSVCTYSPDYECYTAGWPECCGTTDSNLTSDDCPEDYTPVCDNNESSNVTAVMMSDDDSNSTLSPSINNTLSPTTVMVSPCTFAPNYQCYDKGYPKCCGSKHLSNELTEPCPTNGTVPECDVTLSQPTIGRNKTKDDDVPATSNNENNDTITSSEEEEDTMVGSSYCTYAPDYDCYESGWPLCCSSAYPSEDCPKDVPECENNINTTLPPPTTSENKTEDDDESTSSSSPSSIATINVVITASSSVIVSALLFIINVVG